MIEVLSPAPGVGAQLRLRPPRALSGRQFIGLFAALAAVMWLVALLGWWGGNVFAPVFALLYSALVAAALRWLWRLGERGEVIAIGSQVVEVWRSAQSAPAFSAHPYWVRLEVEGDDGSAGVTGSIVLVSSGHRCEVGAFLGPDERGKLARFLREQLQQRRGAIWPRDGTPATHN